MEQAKHTPGPWFIEHHDWLEKGYCCISAENTTAFANVVWLMEDDELIGRNSPEQPANARLIAAAPELLELVEMVYQSFGGGRVITFSDDDIELFRNVYSKATGATQ